MIRKMRTWCLCAVLALSVFSCQTTKNPIEANQELSVAEYRQDYIWLRFKRYPKSAFVAQLWWDGVYQGWHLVKDRMAMPSSEKSQVRVGYVLYDANRKPLTAKKAVILNLRSAKKEAQE